MGSNSQSRKWQMVINNPLEASLAHEVLITILDAMSLTYYCMADEIAHTGTFHTHVFFYSTSPIRFSTIKGRFPLAHIEKAYGSAKENRDYIMKSGKWAETAKAETSVAGSFVEWGQIPAEKEEKAPQMCRLIENIRDGKSTTDIIDDMPNMVFRIKDIETLRLTLLADRYTSENRQLEVTYIFGVAGAGKTRSIYQAHGARNICRITNYRAGRGISFDSYSGQDTIVFEEFNSQIPIEEMLSILDIYPIYLPARFFDRIGCYTKVYITSNLPLDSQYKDVQRERPETWRAFLRRIHKVVEFLSDGTVLERNSGWYV